MQELELIVQRMIQAGESEDKIKLVIEEYTRNVEKTNGSQTEDATAEPVDMASKSEDTFSESPKQNKYDWMRPEVPTDFFGEETKLDYSFFDRTEEDAIGDLKARYPGFKFEETNIFGDRKSFNAIKVSKGDKSIKIEFNIGGGIFETAPTDDPRTLGAVTKYKEQGVDALNTAEKGLLISYQNKNKAYEKAYKDLTTFLDENSTSETDKLELQQETKNVKSYKKHLETTAPTEDQLNQINETFDKEDLFDVKEEEVKVFQGGGLDLKFGAAPRSYVKKTQPYEKELAEARKILQQTSENPSAITEDDVKNKAKEILVTNANKKAWNLNQEKVLEELDDLDYISPEAKKMVKKSLEVGAEQYKKQYASKLTYRELLKEQLDNGKLANRLSTTIERFEDEDYDYSKTTMRPGEGLITLESGKQIPETVFAKYQKDYKEYNDLYKNYVDLSNELVADVEKGFVDRTPDQLDLLKRNYNGVEEFFVDASLGFLELAVDAGYGTAKFFGDSSVDDEAQLKFKDKVRNIRESYKRDVEFDDAFNSLENFGSFATQELANQLSIFAALATPAGWGLIGTSSFGSQYSDMIREDQEPGAVPTSKAKKWWTSLGYAGAETIFGAAPTYMLIKNAKSALLTNASKNSLFGNGVKEYVKKNLVTQNNLVGVVGEPVGEGLTQFTQNILSGRDPLADVDHAMFSGLMFGTALGSVPVFKGMYLSQFSDAKQKEQIRTLRLEQRDLQRKNDLLSRGKSISQNVQFQKQKLIEDNNGRIEELQSLIDLEVSAIDAKAKTLSPAAAREFVSAITRQEDIRLDAQEVLDNDLLSDKDKDKKLLELKQEFDAIQDGVTEFKKSKTWNNNFSIFKGRKENKAEVEKIREEAELALLEQDGITDPSSEQIEEKARIVYNTEQIKKDIAKKTKRKTTALRNTLVSHETTEQTKEYLDKIAEDKIKVIQNSDLTDAQKNNAIESVKAEAETNKSEVDNGAHGFMQMDADGNFVSVVNIENMAKADRLETKTHELQHVLFSDAIGFNPKSFTPLSDAILEWTKANNQDVYKRINAFAERRSDGSLLEQEVVAVFFEEVAAGNINLNAKKNSTFSGMLGYLVGKGVEESSDVDINLAGETDAIKFLVGIANKVKNDQLTLADLSDIKKNKIIQEIRKGKVEKTGQTQFSKVYQEVETMKADLVNPDTKQGTAFIIADTLSNEVDRRLPRIEGITAEERADIVRNFVLDDNRGLVGLLNNYNPDRNDSIMGYLNSSTPGGKLLDARLQEFYKDDPRFGQIFQTTTDEAIATKVERETAIEEEDTDVSKADRKTKLKVLADQLNVADKVKSEVAEANIDIDALTNFNSVPSATPRTVGELLGINPMKLQRTVIDEETGEKIKNKKFKANLTAGEVASAQRWFNKNARLVIDALPQGFDAEGKATGVPKTVLEALYTKREARAKTKAGLRTQVKKPNIKESELLELVDIIDGKPTRDRNTSARIIALADLFGKTITNQEIRKQNPEILKIRDGMSTIMFSKEGKKSKESGDVDLNKIEGKEKQKDWLMKGGFAILPKSFWLNNGQLVGSGARYKNIIVDGEKTKEYELKDGERIAARKMLFANVDQLKDFIKEYEKNGGKFAPENNNVNAAITRTTAYGKKTNKQVLDQANKNKELFNNSDQGFIDIWMAIQKDIQDNPNNRKHWAALLEVTSTTQANWMRVASRLIGGNTLGLTNVEEHMSPATDFAQYLWEMAKINKLTPSVLKKAMKSFTQISLPEVYDKLLKGEGFDYTKNLPLEYKFEILSGIMPSWVRYINPDVNSQVHYIDGVKYKGMNPNVLTLANGNNLAQEFGLGVDSKFEMNQDVISIQQDLLFKVFVNNITKAEAKAELDARMKGIEITKEAAFDRESKQAISDNISNVRPVLQYSEESRGMSTFDFDETLIIDGENFVTATKDGEVVKIPSDKWPIDGPRYAEEGYDFDFSDFVNVRGGKEGPLLQKMKNQIKKYGPKNVFVLTARMQEAAEPIHKWLKSQGINIPLENITGLGKSEGDAKAQWFIDKYAEGYNDMYFVDDALPNVEAVKHVFDQLDVKGKSVQARLQFSKDINLEFNKMLERTKGVAAEKKFSRVVGQKRGKNIGRYRFFVPPSAEDFAGLLYDFYGKGKQGDADMEFMKKALLDPFGRADREMSMARMSILDDYKMLRKELPNVKKKLGKIIDENTGFTFDNAVRVYLFDKAGFEVPGISKRDLEYLRNVVRTDQDLKTFADTLSIISKREEGYIEPGENWSVETIASDLENIVNKIGRKQYLAEFIENKNIIFSPENMNKIEAVYGSRFRNALEDSLYRMENGTNRSKDRNYGQSWTNWVNGSVGAIMFFNGRSAVLQTLSTVNFINFQDNNIFKAGKALANQKQYWSDFTTLFNSDFLKARRAGLQINVNEAELANAVAGAQNKAKAALAYLLKKGFLPTQIADSFAIASGGSTFYRNRIKTYVKQGMDQKAAEEKAFLDFQEIAQETQQSSRPDRISQQQASPLGRLILAFANTPMQYNRLIKKASRDLINNRGDWRSNISRILYYGAIQNIIFSSLQQAIFALSFDDEEDDELDKRTMRIANGMMDTILRGSGVTGAAVATIKNTIMRFMEESERGSRADYGQVAVEVTQVSPPMGSKMRKLYSALNAYKFNREIMGSMDTFDYNNPIWDAAAKVTTATTNVPLDRLFRKTDNIKEAFNQENSAMQRAFLMLGWSSWDLQVGERVVVNKGKKNEYVKYLDTKRQAQEKAEEELKETKKKEKRAKQQRCTAIKSGGGRCKNMVNKPKTRCHFHD